MKSSCSLVLFSSSVISHTSLNLLFIFTVRKKSDIQNKKYLKKKNISYSFQSVSEEHLHDCSIDIISVLENQADNYEQSSVKSLSHSLTKELSVVELSIILMAVMEPIKSAEPVHLTIAEQSNRSFERWTFFSRKNKEGWRCAIWTDIMTVTGGWTLGSDLF